MREMRRRERATSGEQAMEWLKNCEYAVLSMTDPEGNPYAVPVSPVLEGDSLYFHCAPAGFKLDCIRHNPRVCLVCAGGVVPIPEEYSTAYQSAVAFGTAEIVADEAEKIKALRLISEKYAASNIAGFENAIRKWLSHTCVVRVRLDEITGKQKKLPSKKD